MSQLDTDISNLTTDAKSADGQIADLTGKLATANGVITQLQSDAKTSAGVIAAQAARIITLTAQPATPGTVHDAKGAALSVTVPAGTHLLGDSYVNAKFTAAQQYAVLLNSNVVANGISGSSNIAGIRAGVGGPTRASGITLNGASAQDCPQEGVSFYCTGSTFNGTVSTGNGTGSFDAYDELGGGKAWATVGCAFNGCAYANSGNGLWFDGGCKGNVVNGGHFAGLLLTGMNAGKQCSPLRTELTSGHTQNGVNAAAAPQQNSAWIISDSNGIVDNGGIYLGQVGVVDNGRKTYKNPNTGEVIDTSLHDIVFNGTTASSFYWPDSMQYPPSFRGVKLTAAAGSPVAYITHPGKASTPISLADFQKTYDAKASLVAG